MSAETEISPKVKIAAAAGATVTALEVFIEALSETPDYEDPVKVFIAALVITLLAYAKKDPRRT